ncbi:GNAT family N-acetyltransferase [Alicyclobacillus sp. SO9]|uniref:GNAT family N-acetyltransferase n=1 Tax=Alicyclobacillus sp. SO9 TaxID=2665646 RepID=UPI001E5EC625|nr:GNAT family protein [Alicyclobacillus sp. SO9]
MEDKIFKIDYSDYFWQDDKVRLRAIHPEDWGREYIGTFETSVRRLLECSTVLPPTITGSKRFVEENADFSSKSGRLMFIIEDFEGNSVGEINLNNVDERNGTFSIGTLIDKGNRGMGYGTRAMKILLKYAFLERRLHKFNDYILEGNDASAKMMKRLGCIQEGVRRQVAYINGKYMDFILFGLTKDEFIESHKEELNL